MDAARKPYPSDLTDDEWAFVALCLALVRLDAHPRRHDRREVPDAVRRLVETGCPWRYTPTHSPPWEAVYPQALRWAVAGAFEAMAHDLRAVLRVAAGRAPNPSAAIRGGRTVPPTPESGSRAGYDGHERRGGRRCTPPWMPWGTCSPCR